MESLFSFSHSFSPAHLCLSFSFSPAAQQLLSRRPTSLFPAQTGPPSFFLPRPVSLAPAISRPSQRRPFLSFSLSDAGDPPVIPELGTGRDSSTSPSAAARPPPTRRGPHAKATLRSYKSKARDPPLNPADPQPPPLAFANPSSHPPQIRAWANAAPPFRRVSAAFELSRSFAPR